MLLNFYNKYKKLAYNSSNYNKYYWLLYQIYQYKYAVLQQVLCKPLNVQLRLYVLDKGCWCTVDVCSARPSVESCAHPTPKSLTPPPHPSHFRLSLLTALQKDGPGIEHTKTIRTQPNLWNARWCEWILLFVFILILFSCGAVLK